ncbi:helix-turn-helix domain-containing protein [Streptomyces sp. NPDC058398]|uniref:helix-turn-helix domain-containing protein n=1 Tax=Streptomyces sp. NPDC058398 TaxID=3346479 RepID=UPI003648867A
MLRQLKARSDRSYAALARHLNMNASTLHRYCSGEAVPLGFAPVERFAALCGAAPAQRVELHRLWVLAVAARQRSRTTPGADAAPPPPSAPPAPPAPSAPSAAESASPSPSDAMSPSAIPSPHEPEAASPGSSPVTTGTTGTTRTAAETGPEHNGAPRRPWYRRRVAVAAAVVTALFVTLGSLSALPSGHAATDAGDRVSGAPTGKAAGDARHGSATPSPSPSTTPSRPSGSPSPSPSGSGDTSPSPSTNPSPTGVSAGPPLTVTVNSHRWAVGCGHTYVIGKSPDQVPPPPAPQDASPWARTQNAVHGEETIVDLTVQGRSDAAVVLEALRVRVVGRSAPLKGTAYATGGGCGGAMGVGSFAVDLDKDRPVARPVPSDDDGTGSKTLSPPFRVSVKDPQVLMVDALTESCDCRWYLELDWSSRGRTGTVRIDDQGVPFRTSGIKGLPHYWYRTNGWTLTTAG